MRLTGVADRRGAPMPTALPDEHRSGPGTHGTRSGLRCSAPLTRIELAGSRVTGGPHHQVSSAANHATLYRLSYVECTRRRVTKPATFDVAESRRVERPARRLPAGSSRVGSPSPVLSITRLCSPGYTTKHHRSMPRRESNPLLPLVEPRGIEPRSLVCRTSIFPLDDGPSVDRRRVELRSAPCESTVLPLDDRPAG